MRIEILTVVHHQFYLCKVRSYIFPIKHFFISPILYEGDQFHLYEVDQFRLPH